MIVLSNAASMQTALTTPLRADLHGLLACRIRHTLGSGLGDLTTIVVVFSSDSEEALADEIGGTLLFNALDGKRYGEAEFTPAIDWLDAHEGWWELILCVGDTGFAYVLLVEERDDELGRMCRLYGQH